MPKLYAVEVEYSGSETLLVYAEDEGEAECLALQETMPDDLDYSTYINEVAQLSDIPKSWCDDAPINSELTCRELLVNALDDKELPDTRQLILGETPARKAADTTDQKCAEYARILKRCKADGKNATDTDIDRAYELAHDRDIQRRLTEAVWRDENARKQK